MSITVVCSQLFVIVNTHADLQA